MSQPPTDWRGTPIHVGDTVIYGAPVGRSIAMVEATVDGFTPSGRVWLLVKHRAYGGYGQGQPRVHVGADRLTVVSALPPTNLPLEEDKNAEQRGRSLRYHHEELRRLTTGFVPLRFQGVNDRGEALWTDQVRDELIAYHRREYKKLAKS